MADRNVDLSTAILTTVLTTVLPFFLGGGALILFKYLPVHILSPRRKSLTHYSKPIVVILLLLLTMRLTMGSHAQ